MKQVGNLVHHTTNKNN